MSIPKKAGIFQSLVLAEMTYNVHTWGSVSQQEMEHWTHHMRPAIGTILKNALVAQEEVSSYQG